MCVCVCVCVCVWGGWGGGGVRVFRNSEWWINTFILATHINLNFFLTNAKTIRIIRSNFTHTTHKD